MPKLQYPAFFENGQIGARCTAEIKNREAFLFIPQKMIFSLDKVQNNKKLRKIICENPHCFSRGNSEKNDLDLLTLTLGLFYEVTQGAKSYWYPYLLLILDNFDFGSEEKPQFWLKHELEMLGDNHCKLYLL